MDMGLAGQSVVVVGGARGIGLAIAAQFALEGASVGIFDSSPQTSQAAAGLTAQHGTRALGLVVDIREYGSLVRALRQAAEHLGPILHVVHAAAIGSGKYGFPFWNLSPEDWRPVLDVNVTGAVHVAHAFAPAMVEARAGSMLFLASVAAQIGSQSDPPYSASKAAVINFMQCVAKDLAPFGARANALSPGMVRTDLNRSVWQAWHDREPPARRQSYEEWAEAKVRRIAPLGRWQEPQELAAMAVYLASPHARNITGQTVNVDGGQVMHW